MAKRKKQWVYSLPKPSVPPELKPEIEAQAEVLLEELRAKMLDSSSEHLQLSHPKELWTKWYRNYFYFCGTYEYVGDNAIVPTFEGRFARMEYAGEGCWNLAYMRHTGKWWEVSRALSTEKAFEALRTKPYFFPF